MKYELYKKNACVSPSKYTQGHWTLVGTQRYTRGKKYHFIKHYPYYYDMTQKK